MFTLPGVLESLSAVRQCCDRMTRAGNRRMELEMTLIRLCTDYQQQNGEIKALTNRIAMLEQQLQALKQNGIPASPLPQPQRQKPAASQNIPAQNLQMEGKPDTKQFLPLKNWAAVLERFYDLAPTIAGLLENSNAYTFEEKGMLLIMVRNSLFKRLFRQQDSEMLLDAAEQVLGKRYQLRYKVIEAEAEQTAPADLLLQRAREQGIRTGEQDGSSL